MKAKSVESINPCQSVIQTINKDETEQNIRSNNHESIP